MQKKRLLILAFSSLGSLFAQDLPQLRLLGQPEKSATEFVGANIVDVNGRTCAAIQVLSDLNGFSYDAYNQVVRVDDKPGRDMVYLQPEEQVLEILLSGYQPLKLILREIGIRLASREVWVIKISGEQKSAQIPIAILTNPGGARVTIDGIDRGQGEQHLVTAGAHTLQLDKPGYQTFETTLTADEKNALFRYELKKMDDINVQITSVPDQAMVYIDDVRVDATPVNSFFPAGRHVLRVEKEWYLPFEEVIDLQPPFFRETVKLQEDFGTLEVKSSPQTGLEVWLNNSRQAQLTPCIFNRLAPGSYTLKARSDLYETDEQTVSLKRGDRQMIVLLSSERFATLTITTRPGTAVYLNGKKQEQLQNIRLEPQIVVLRAELPKAPPLEKRLVLRRGEYQTVDLYPEIPAGTIQVSTVPLDAKIVLQGDSGEYYEGTGAKVFSGIPVGKYVLTVSHAGYTVFRDEIQLRADQKITQSVKLEVTKVIRTVTPYSHALFATYTQFPADIQTNSSYAENVQFPVRDIKVHSGYCLRLGMFFHDGEGSGAYGGDLGLLMVNEWRVLNANLNYLWIKNLVPGRLSFKIQVGGGLGLVADAIQDWQRPEGSYNDVIGRNSGDARAPHFATYALSVGPDIFLSSEFSLFLKVGYYGFAGAFTDYWLDNDYDSGDKNSDDRFFELKQEWLKYSAKSMGGMSFELGLSVWKRK